MYEHVAMPAGTHFDFVIDKAGAGCLQALYRSSQVGYMQSDMMKPRPALLEELSNCRVGHGRFKQLDAAFTDRHHRHSDFLGLDHFFRHNFEPELLVKLLCFGERLHGDAKVINLRHWCVPSSATISSTREYGSRLCSATSAAKRSASPFPR